MTALVDAPGRYRRGGVAVMGQGRIHHVGPPAARVPLLMADLLEWLGRTDEHPLIGVSDAGEIVGAVNHNRSGLEASEPELEPE